MMSKVVCNESGDEKVRMIVSLLHPQVQFHSVGIRCNGGRQIVREQQVIQKFIIVSLNLT
jgi:hypothetical protein